mgnify:CR=1 FL=1
MGRISYFKDNLPLNVTFHKELQIPATTAYLSIYFIVLFLLHKLAWSFFIKNFMSIRVLFTMLTLGVIIFSSCNKTGPLGPTGPQGIAGPTLSGNLKGFINHYDLSGSRITTDLAGCVISVDLTTQTATTDATGLYTLSGFSTGVYNLSVQPISVTYGSISASYGPVKIQNLQFIGNGDKYHNVNLSMVPTNNIISSTASVVGGSAVNIAGSIPIATYPQRVIVYVGAPGSTTVDATAPEFVSFYMATAVSAGGNGYTVSIPITDLQNLGYQSGSTPYFATYLMGYNIDASRYVDVTTNKTIYTAISTAPITSTVTLP